MVVPGELQNGRRRQRNRKRDGGAPEFLDHNIERQRHQGNLPRDAYGDIEHIAQEVFVAFEAGVFGQNLFQHRAPEAPRPHAAIEVHQHLIRFRLGQ